MGKSLDRSLLVITQMEAEDRSLQASLQTQKDQHRLEEVWRRTEKLNRTEDARSSRPQFDRRLPHVVFSSQKRQLMSFLVKREVLKEFYSRNVPTLKVQDQL